jgi:1-acyl-sn-glycerol-3-phosphate acyltransferase
VSAPHDDRTLAWKILAFLVGVAWDLAFRLRVAGSARVPTTGPAIVAGNHLSALDGVVLGLAVNRRRKRMVRFLAGAEFFERRRIGWALRACQQIPVRRGARDLGALDEAIAAVRQGSILGIFPEGKVNPGLELQRGKRGIARIALATGTPVVPVGIWGTQHRWPRSGFHLRRPWRPTVAVTFGEPIEPEGDPGSPRDLARFVARVMAGIAEQVDRARALAVT